MSDLLETRPPINALVYHESMGPGMVLRHLPDADLVSVSFERRRTAVQIPWVDLSARKFTEDQPVLTADEQQYADERVTVGEMLAEESSPHLHLVPVDASDYAHEVTLRFSRKVGTDPDIDAIVDDIIRVLRDASHGFIGDPDRPLGNVHSVTASYLKEFG